MNHSRRFIGIMIIMIFLSSFIAYAADTKAPEKGAVNKLIEDNKIGITPKPAKETVTDKMKQTPGSADYYVSSKNNRIIPLIKGELKIKDVVVSAKDLQAEGYVQNKYLTSNIYEDIKKADSFRVEADGSINYWGKSTQEWSRGLKEYKTTIRTENKLSANGELRRTVEEYVLDKASKLHKELSEADKKANLGYQVSKVELVIDKKTGQLKRKIKNQYYQGNKIGSTEEVFIAGKWNTIFNVMQDKDTFKSYTLDNDGNFIDLAVEQIGEDYLKVSNDLLAWEVIEDATTQDKENAEMDRGKKLLELNEAKRYSESAEQVYNYVLEEYRDAEAKYQNSQILYQNTLASIEADKAYETAVTAYTKALTEFDKAQEATTTAKPGEEYQKAKQAFYEAETKLEQAKENEYKAKLEVMKADAERTLDTIEEAKKLLDQDKVKLEIAEENEDIARFDSATADEDLAIATALFEEAKKVLEDAAKEQGLSRESIKKLNTELDALLAKAKTTGKALTFDELYDALLAKKGLTPAMKKMLEKAKQKMITIYLTLPVSVGKKISAMGTWRFLGVLTHSFNQYKGFAYLSALIFDSDYLQEAAKRKQEIQDKFCVIGGLKECWTSHICEGFISSSPSNYMLTKGPDTAAPMGAALLVGERSDSIEFKGLTRQELVDLFGEQTFIDGVKVDFTDPKLDIKKMEVITMWLYNAQMRVNNPLDRDLHVNVEFRGPERRARWFSDWKYLKPGQGATRHFIKYSTTDYNQICLVFKEKIDEFVQDYEDLWARTILGGIGSITGGLLPAAMQWTDADFPGAKSEYCVPFAGAGPASTMDSRNLAANNLQSEDAEDGTLI